MNFEKHRKKGPILALVRVYSTTVPDTIPAQHFYINIVLLNKDEAVKERVQEKAG